MAAVALLGSATFNTTNGTKTVTATPTLSDLIVIITAHTSNTSVTAPTDDNSSGTYTRVATAFKASSADLMQVWIRNSLIGSSVSTVFTHAPGTTNGGGLVVLRVSSMTRYGSMACRQTAVQENQASATPAPVFNAAVLTGNPVIGAVFNAGSAGSVVAHRSSPAYTERADLGYTSPTTGIEVMTIDSGETASTITWGGSSASAFCSVVLELDATADLGGRRMSTLGVG